jgi:hypothetical protein
MSTFGLIAIIVLPVLGGLIAWAGDVIGYRLGKSRRSLFGLRPRTTARLVGVAVGVGLPLAGLATALLGSNYARRALFELDSLVQTQDTLEKQNAELNGRVTAARRAASSARQEADTRRLEAVRNAKDALKAARGLGEAQGRLRQARLTLNRLSGDVRGLTAAKWKLTKTKDELKGRVEALRTERDRLNGQIAADLTRKKAEVTALEVRRDDATKAYQAQRKVASGPVLFEPGHELIRVVTPDPKPAEAEMVTALRGLIGAADAAVRERGGAAGSNVRTTKLISPLPAEWNPAGEYPTPDEIIRYAAGQLVASPEPRFVIGARVDPRFRVFVGEDVPARVELWWVPSVRVFARDELIYAAQVDGAGARAEIYNQLYNLITKLVRREVQQKGLLPDPNTGQYGSLPSDRLLGALDDIAARKQTVRVEVTAAKDTFTSDPLVIKIEVKDGGQTLRPTPRSHRG